MKKMMNSIIIVSFCTIVSKVLSFLSEMIIANYLGTSMYADAYSMISGIHAVVYPMLGIGIWSIFLPEYKKMNTKKNKNEINAFSNKIITLFIIISLFISIIIFVFSRQIINLVSPGFSSETKNIASLLLRIYSPYFAFSIVSSIYAAMLQSNDKFFGSQIREVVSYLPIIIIGPILYKYIGVYGFAISLIIGGIFRLLVQIPFVDWGYKYKIDFNLKTTKVKQLIKKIPSVLVSSATDQIHTLVDKIMASSLTVGSVASLNYGSKLINVVNGILTNSIATVLYPKMAELIGKNKIKEANHLLKTVLITIAILIVPCMIIGILFSNNIVSLIYKRGSFDSQSVLMTSSVFVGYLLGIYFIGVKSFIDKFLYALNKNNYVMKLSIFNIIFNIILNAILMKSIGLSGLAYATSISSIAYIFISLFYLYKNISYGLSDFIKKITLIISSNIIIIISLFYLFNCFISFWFLKIFLTTIVSIIIIIIFYIVIKIDEFRFLVEFLKNFGKKADN